MKAFTNISWISSPSYFLLASFAFFPRSRSPRRVNTSLARRYFIGLLAKLVLLSMKENLFNADKGALQFFCQLIDQIKEAALAKFGTKHLQSRTILAVPIDVFQ